MIERVRAKNLLIDKFEKFDKCFVIHINCKPPPIESFPKANRESIFRMIKLLIDTEVD